MEVRDEDHDIKTSGYSSGFGGHHNGTAVVTCTQTLRRSPHPDRVSGGAAVVVAPISVGSTMKPSRVIRYLECLKNHAASVGGNIHDGCGEFMASEDEGILEALKCAACDCHRKFHLKEVDGETQFGANSIRRSLILNPLPLPSPTMLHHHLKYLIHTSPSSTAMVAPVNVAFGGTESSSEDLNELQSNAAEGMSPLPPYVSSKKRFRTKFTPEQKDKMLEFAEKLGWRINKQDEEDMEKFCADVGVKRKVF